MEWFRRSDTGMRSSLGMSARETIEWKDLGCNGHNQSRKEAVSTTQWSEESSRSPNRETPMSRS
jgi:hypothetical protein